MFVLYASILLLFNSQQTHVHAIQATANVQLHNTSTSIGTLTFVQNDRNSPITITGTLTSLNASSSHGFHVHAIAIAQSSPDCNAAGAHLNPYNTSHGPPTADIMHRHVGDLGNITTDANGVAPVNIQDSIINFFITNQSIAGLPIVIHLMPDDGGNTNMGTSNTTGNAGVRVACGTINVTSNGLSIGSTMSTLMLVIVLTAMMFF